MRIQSSAVDENGLVPEPVRKGLLDTLDRYGKWQTTSRSLRDSTRHS